MVDNDEDRASMFAESGGDKRSKRGQEIEAVVFSIDHDEPARTSSARSAIAEEAVATE